MLGLQTCGRLVQKPWQNGLGSLREITLVKFQWAVRNTDKSSILDFVQESLFSFSDWQLRLAAILVHGMCCSEGQSLKSFLTMSKSKKHLKTQSIYQLHKGGFKTHKTQEAKIFFSFFVSSSLHINRLSSLHPAKRLCRKPSELSIFSPSNLLAFFLS